jgi:hypothetical protein
VGSKNRFRVLSACICLLAGTGAALPQNSEPKSDAFESVVVRVLNEGCAPCHNTRTASGGMDVSALSTRESLKTYRELWERTLKRIDAGQMPPRQAPKPAGLREMSEWVRKALDAEK